MSVPTGKGSPLKAALPQKAIGKEGKDSYAKQKAGSNRSDNNNVDITFVEIDCIFASKTTTGLLAQGVSRTGDQIAIDPVVVAGRDA